MKYSKKFILFLIYFANVLCSVNCYKILCAFPTGSRSHFIVAEYLMKGLAAQGHNVTVINQYPLEAPLSNYREVIIPMNKHQDAIMKEFTKVTGSVMQMFLKLPSMMKLIYEDCENLLHDERVKKIMAEETFDLVIIESMMGNSLAGLASHFNCPLIFFSSLKTTNEVLEVSGAPKALSYVPFYMADYTGVMSFMQRLMNMGFFVLDTVVTLGYSKMFHKEIYERNFPQPKYPIYEKAVQNASLTFVSHHFSQGNVRPLPPNVVEISGLQLNDNPKPLPDDLQNWMDNSSKLGVIYFSLGTNMNSKTLSPDIMHTILKSFSKLKLNILWKFDKLDIPDLPKNVRIEKWVPQVELLQHKNLKLFITHGGLGSITDAKIYGVPLLLIPIFADQMGNSKTVVEEGWGIEFQFDKLTEQLLTDSIAEVLNNPTYRNQALYTAKLFRDRPLSPMQTAIFWTEYVIRHRGAKHMRPNSLHLNFVQLHSLDVIGFLVCAVLLIVGIFYVLLKFVFRRLIKLIGGGKPKIE